jgi:uncharacterized damage-inducible protein DinB
MNEILQLFLHLYWADVRLLEALEKGGPPEAFREFAHVIGAEEIWLARLQGRKPRCAVWPELTASDLSKLMEAAHAAYRDFLSQLPADRLDERVGYTNSEGRKFSSTIEEILLHVTLHAQYHRGKVNLLLRQSGLAPAPTDYIAWARGAPAATEASSRKSRENQ